MSGATTRGRFIAIEGCDGSGKTTQAQLLAERLGAVFTREPGGTALGTKIRSLVLGHHGDGTAIGFRTEALLMAADRAQHVSEQLRPVLVSGGTVVCDRYIASSIAYQGYGRGLDVDEVRRLSEWATQGLWPDLTVLVRVPVEVALARLAATGDPDRLESERELLLPKVIAGFDALAAEDPTRWRVVDGTGSIAEVAEAVAFAVAEVLG